ncbi:MAG: hypothetical protein ACKO6Q_06195 [Bacteroidota bacterium]
MRPTRMIWLLIVFLFMLTSCGLMRNMFRRKSGCPSNGKNVGAEQIISGDPKAMKAVRHAKKFRN